jgi:hypothetical protein
MGDRKQEPREVEDLEVPPDTSQQVKGGVGDVNGDGPAFQEGDPDQPITGGIVAKKLPGKRKPPTLTL